MKVLHISLADGYSSSGGGGTIAVWRLHRSLRKAGIDSKILCGQKSFDSVLEDEATRNYMGQRCRAIALEEYSSELWAQRYIELYRHCLENNAAQTMDDLVYGGLPNLKIVIFQCQ